MSYSETVWLFFYILSIVLGFGLIGSLPFPIPVLIQMFTMGMGFLCQYLLDKKEED